MTDSTEESAREALRGAIARKSAIVAELAEIDAAIVEAARRRDGIGLQLNSSTAHARAKAWPAQALRQGLPSLDLPAELQSELSELDGTTKQRNELHAAIEALDAQRRASETLERDHRARHFRPRGGSIGRPPGLCCAEVAGGPRRFCSGVPGAREFDDCRNWDFRSGGGGRRHAESA